MKSVLLVLTMLFGSILTFGQAATPQTPAPAPHTPQPIIEAGGLDDRCQVGLSGSYQFDEKGFGTNDSKESERLSNASTCIGYITGWTQTLSGAYITENGSLWYVEISEAAKPLKLALGLHEFLVAHPDTRTVSSPLVLLKIAIDQGVGRVTQVEMKSEPSQENENQARLPV